MNIQKLTNATMNFDQSAIDEKINSIRSRVYKLEKHVKTTWLIKAIGFLDLTTLGSDDTPAKIEALCVKAVHPLKLSNDSNLHTASVYVYPLRLMDAITALEKLDKDHKISRATVGGGFPSGQYLLETRLREVELDVELGADEIDIVINRPLVLMHQWQKLYEELKLFRTACGNKCLKVILATGELGNLENVYKASMIAMMAGADFIKTSTGKEAINATLPVGIVMCRAIKDYYESTQKKIGLKPAGGIKVPQEALEWMMLVQMELGEEWLCKDLFRIGSSNLLDNIIEEIQ
ncbi:deoxyribose-phosphate aldolase isoform X1 [Apis laboriosa]|uniref:deoxyribose-phosphate aldolase isoform X1 n=2 Tax=Apis laboriosa TaxID=183418 RepID=UPI001CC7FA7D|nr:deoxyribose-phosphate aldolase isoform X1 [Apis laboriosa]